MKAKKESIVLSVILLCLILIAVGMSYAFLKTSFFGSKTSVLKVGSLSLILDETSGNAITVEDGTPMYDSEGVKQDNYFTFALKNNGTLDSSYTIYLENQPLDEGDIRVNSSYVRYSLEKDSSILQPASLEGNQAIDKGIIKKNQTINYKMRLWFASDIPQSEENKVFKAKLNVVGNQNTKMMAPAIGLTNDERNSVTKVVFQDSIKSIDNETRSWDVSAAKNKTVMARLVPNTDDDTTNTLYIQSSAGEVFANSNNSAIFFNMRQLKTIENIELLNTSSVTNMQSMFIRCTSLESIDVSHFDTSNVTNMSGIFSGCNSVKYLDVSKFNTSKVSDMGGMFQGCNNLTSLDLSNFNTQSVTSMSNMFQRCTNLTDLNISSFDTSNVTTMSGMFYYCSSLTSLDVSKFNTSNVTDMSNMFRYCNNLTNLNVSHFDTSKVVNMSSMFQGCNNLKSLNLTKFDTSNVTNMSHMFTNCQSITNLDLSNFNTSEVTDMSDMFNSCYSLITLNVSNFDTSNVTTMAYMFNNCRSLVNIDLGSFNTSNVTNMNNIFYWNEALTYINFKSADFSNVTSYDNMFYNISKTVEVVVKDATAKSFIENKLDNKGTVTIA